MYMVIIMNRIKIYIFAILTLLLLCLVSCQKEIDLLEIDKVDSIGDDIVSIYEGIDSSGFDENTNVWFVRTESELEYHFSKVRTSNEGSFNDVLSKHQSKFFENNMIIIIYDIEPTLSSKIIIDDLKIEDDSVNIHIVSKSFSPDVDEMKYYFVVIDLEKNDNLNQINITKEERFYNSKGERL